jgi:hypothetical protein
VNARATNCSNVARVLGVHLRNIATTMVQLSLTCDSGEAFSEKKKTNKLLPTTRNEVVQWRTKETLVSLYKSKVTRKD